jgi:membrane protease YdiL (CAAX protease family)
VNGFLWPVDGGTTVAVAIGVILLAMAFMQYGPYPALERRAGLRVPGSQLRPYTPKDVNTFLNALRRGGRRRFRTALISDLAFAIAYSAGLVVVLNGTLGVAAKEPLRHAWLVLIPSFGGAFDLIENLLFLAAVPGDGHRPIRPRLITVAAVFTILKWIGVLITLILILAGALALAIVGAGEWDLHRLAVPLVMTLLIVVVGQLVLGPLLGRELRRTKADRWWRQVIGGAWTFDLLVALLVGAIVWDLWPDVVTASRAERCACLSRWSAGLAGGLLLLVSLWTPSFLRGQKDPRFDWLRGKRLLAKLGLLIPSTVLFEELAFRGLLFHLWDAEFGPEMAVTATALAFGLWHVHSAGERPRSTTEKSPFDPGRPSVIPTVGFTAVAGVGFGLLRLASGCLLPSILVHWGVNAAGVVLVVRNAARRDPA